MVTCQLVAQDPTAFFHILSKDTGFDPLIQHLKERKVLASRSKDVTDIPLLKATNSKSTPEKIAVVVANLRQRGASKPRTIRTLSSMINSLFQKQLTEDELGAVLEGLQSRGIITVAETKVTYALPASDS